MDIIWETGTHWQRRHPDGLSFGKVRFQNKFCKFYVFTSDSKLKVCFAVHSTMIFSVKPVKERI